MTRQQFDIEYNFLISGLGVPFRGSQANAHWEAWGWESNPVVARRAIVKHLRDFTGSPEGRYPLPGSIYSRIFGSAMERSMRQFCEGVDDDQS